MREPGGADNYHTHERTIRPTQFLRGSLDHKVLDHVNNRVALDNALFLAVSHGRQRIQEKNSGVTTIVGAHAHARVARAIRDGGNAVKR